MPPSSFGLLHSHTFTLERGAGGLRNITSTPSVSQEGPNLTSNITLGKKRGTSASVIVLFLPCEPADSPRAVRWGCMRLTTGLCTQEGRLCRGYRSFVVCFSDKQRWLVFHVYGCLQLLAAYRMCICATVKMRNAGRCEHGVERSHS